jgi:hypothetical protein
MRQPRISALNERAPECERLWDPWEMTVQGVTAPSPPSRRQGREDRVISYHLAVYGRGYARTTPSAVALRVVMPRFLCKANNCLLGSWHLSLRAWQSGCI